MFCGGQAKQGEGEIGAGEGFMVCCLSNTKRLHHLMISEKPPHTARAPAYLRQLDSSLLEGAGAGIMSADVAVLAPVAPVRALHT